MRKWEADKFLQPMCEVDCGELCNFCVRYTFGDSDVVWIKILFLVPLVDIRANVFVFGIAYSLFELNINIVDYYN